MRAVLTFLAAAGGMYGGKKITVPGLNGGPAEEVPIAVALRMAFSKEGLLKSNERLRRVRSEGHSAKASVHADQSQPQETILHLLDPVCVLIPVGGEEGATTRGVAHLAFGHVKSLALREGGGVQDKVVRGVTQDELDGGRVTAELGLLLWQQGPDEWLESSGRTVPRVSVTVTGSACRYMAPFNPDLSEDGCKYRLSVEDLQLVKANMEELVSCPSGSAGASDSLPSVTGVLLITDTGE